MDLKITLDNARTRKEREEVLEEALSQVDPWDVEDDDHIAILKLTELAL